MTKGDHYQRVLNSLQEPIVIVDRNYRIRDVNKAFCREYKADRDEIIGEFCYKVTHGLDTPCFRKGVQCPLQEVFQSGQQVRIVHQHLLPGGITQWEEVLASPLKDEMGQLVYVVEELRDITELLKTREIVEELASELKMLSGILPICANCKKIRNEEGNWESLEAYIHDRSEATFSHGICPECKRKLYPDLADSD